MNARADQSKKTNALTTGTVRGGLLRLAIPISIGIFFTVLFHAVDTLYIARLGAAPLTAISFTFPVIMALTHLAMGIATGTTSYLSRLHGAEKTDRAGRAAFDTLILGAVIGVLLCIIGLYTITPVFSALGAGQSLLPPIHDYMGLWYIALIFIVMLMLSNNVIRAAGDTKTPMKILMSVSILNLVLDPFLIFGSYGIFPRMEMEGAALATLIASALGFAMSLTLLIRRGLIHFGSNWPSFHATTINTLHIGLPSTISYMMPAAGMALMTILIAGYGPEAVSAFGICTRVEALFLVFFMGLSIAMNVFTGQNLGAKNPARVEEAKRLALKMSLVVGLFSALVLGLAHRSIAPIFSEESATLIISALYFLIVPISYIAFGYGMVMSAALNAHKKPMSALSISFTRHIGVFLPLAFGLELIWGLPGLFVALSLANIFSGLLAFGLSRRATL